MPERIQKVLANAGIGSRRSIERWVAEGRITVDGRVAKLGEQLAGRERVCLDGKPLRLTAAKLARPQSHGFLAFYKPGPTRGSADSDDLSLPRPRFGRWIDVSPIDRNTSGLVVLTTDGELASALMHPSAVVEREYAVRVLGEPTDSQLDQLKAGVQLDSGVARVVEIGGRRSAGSNAWYHLTIQETRHRDLRPALAAVGIAVSRVIRIRYHTIELGDLYRGASRPLLPAESRALYSLVGDSRRRTKR